jgi:lipopolysaccharide/colanic/teichoic acid biosynthesis glycosyltransferase
MREKRSLPTKPDEIHIPKFLEKVSRKKGKEYRQGKTKRRVVDFGIGGLARALTYPAEIGIRAVVRAIDGKPTLYPAEREGSDGVIFIAPKIRTMQNGADKSGSRYEQGQKSGNHFHDTQDPRVTRLGHFLRRHDADELPQLKLVRKGVMSLVDIRPHLKTDEEILEQNLGEEGAKKRRKARSEGKPGVINLPAVFDREKIRAGDPAMGNEWDIWFAENDSFGLDVYVVSIFASMKVRNFYNRVKPPKQNKSVN